MKQYEFIVIYNVHCLYLYSLHVLECNYYLLQKLGMGDTEILYYNNCTLECYNSYDIY